MKSCKLKGLRVLVTRPQPQANKLSLYLEDSGAETAVMPMVKIEPLFTRESLPDDSPLTDPSMFNKIIAVSIPSVEIAFNLTPAKTGSADWFTPGLSSAKALSRFGITASCPDSDFTSEALLALPALQNIAGERILLLKGKGGRDLLVQELKKRDADVTSLAVYQRICPNYSDGLLIQTVAVKKINAIVATSSQIVTHLMVCARSGGTGNMLSLIPLLVPSKRVAEHARKNGFERVVISKSAGNQDIAEALQQLVK